MNIYTETAFVSAIREVEANRDTGVLTLSSLTQRIIVIFREGRIESLSSNLDNYRLGQFLLSWLEIDQLHKLLADGDRLQLPLGECAVRSGLVAESKVLEAVRQQAFSLFLHALKARFEVHSFSSFGAQPVAGETVSRPFRIATPISLDWLVLSAARRLSTPLVVLPTQRVALNSYQDLPKFEWFPQELAVLGKLREYPRTLPELTEETGQESAFIRKILSTLSQMGVISLHEVPEPGTAALMKPTRLPLELLIPKVHNPVLDRKLEVLQNPYSFASEQFRTLKVRLREVIEQEDHRKVVCLTSPHSEDGKSLVSANLAFTLADDLDQRVCLIDCDFRKPSLHRLLGIDMEPGLANFLEEENVLPPHCYMRRVGNLYTLTVGFQPENPVEFLSLQRMRRLFDYLKAEFDTVILDCPPNLPIADTQLLAHHGDIILLVVRQAKTPYAAIEKALRGIDPEKFLGVIFNDVKAQPFHTYYDYAYYNGTASGYSSRAPRRLKTRVPRSYSDL